MDHDTPPTAPGVRARVRAELTAAIKDSARRQLATEGASMLSLRAIARELDMASSAIYRYFASKDELLTALIIDAFNALGDRIDQELAVAADTSPFDRWMIMSTAMRRWAIEHPHEYALIYGSPVPGYAAPEDTIDPAARIPLRLIHEILDDPAHRKDPRSPLPPLDDAVAASVASLAEFSSHVIPTELLAQALQTWAELIGLISMEVFGHLTNAVDDFDTFFVHAMESEGRRLLLPESTPSTKA